MPVTMIWAVLLLAFISADVGADVLVEQVWQRDGFKPFVELPQHSTAISLKDPRLSGVSACAGERIFQSELNYAQFPFHAQLQLNLTDLAMTHTWTQYWFSFAVFVPGSKNELEEQPLSIWNLYDVAGPTNETGTPAMIHRAEIQLKGQQWYFVADQQVIKLAPLKLKQWTVFVAHIEPTTDNRKIKIWQDGRLFVESTSSRSLGEYSLNARLGLYKLNWDFGRDSVIKGNLATRKMFFDHFTIAGDGVSYDDMAFSCQQKSPLSTPAKIQLRILK